MNILIRLFLVLALVISMPTIYACGNLSLDEIGEDDDHDDHDDHDDDDDDWGNGTLISDTTGGGTTDTNTTTGTDTTGTSGTSTSTADIGALSIDPAIPTDLTLDTISSFSIEPGETGYATFDVTDGKGYGLYLTQANGDITLGAGLYDSALTTQSTYPTAGTGGTLGIGLTASAVSATTWYVGEIENTTAGSITGELTLRDGDMGGSTSDTAITIALNSSTWVGADSLGNEWFSFTTGLTAGIYKVQFANLTSGVDIELLESDGLTVVTTLTTDGAVSDTTKSVSSTSLLASTVYKFRVVSTTTDQISFGRMKVITP